MTFASDQKRASLPIKGPPGCRRPAVVPKASRPAGGIRMERGKMDAGLQAAYPDRRTSIWCGMASRTFEPLARRLCKTVHELMAAPPDQWVALSTAAKAMNV